MPLNFLSAHKYLSHPKKLRRLFVIFFIALAIPTSALIAWAYQQLKWEAIHQQQLKAKQTIAQINEQLGELLAEEEQRPFTDYSFFNVSSQTPTQTLIASPLSRYPTESNFPGLIGYFQVDSQGAFTTPLIPSGSVSQNPPPFSADEQAQRLQLQQKIFNILSANQLLAQQSGLTEKSELAERSGSSKKSSSPKKSDSFAANQQKQQASQSYDTTEDLASEIQAPSINSTQAGFDRLNKLRSPASLKPKSSQSLTSASSQESRSKFSKSAKRAIRKEQNALPEPIQMQENEETLQPTHSLIKINLFQSEIEPFELAVLNSGHLVLFRKVWKNNERLIQGAIIEQALWFDATILKHFNAASLDASVKLTLAHQGKPLLPHVNRAHRRGYYRQKKFEDPISVFQTALAAPFDQLDLLFTAQKLETGPTASVIELLSLIIFIILSGGLFFMYRLSIKQLEVSQQQQNFVSSVSHELKTPLTSIRMYGELLQQGWTSEENKTDYYQYICDESDRLSRLITNVLQLSKMSRDQLQVTLKEVSLNQLFNEMESKLLSMVNQKGFQLEFNIATKLKERKLAVDQDAFCQIMINLVDNAIKFSARAKHKKIEIHSEEASSGTVHISVRDYGKGIAKNQLKDIFKLFYRSEDELTRETTGTGIGLSLVQQLTHAMNGQVTVTNESPGARFTLTFPLI